MGGSNAIRDLAADPARLDETWALVRSYCARLLGSVDDAEDATQAAFERGLRSGPETGDPRPWLITVARNVCIDMIRRRAHTAAGGLDDEMADMAGAGNFERDVVTRDLLRTAFASLTPSERRAVGAAWMADQRSEDAARSIGMGDSALRTLLSRARRKLVAHIEEAERSIAGLFPWLGDLRHRAARRLLAGTRRDATWQERLTSLAAPATAIALTLTSLAVIAPHAGSSRRAIGSSNLGPAAAAHDGSGAVAKATQAGTTSPLAPAGAAPLGSLLPALHPSRPQDAQVTDVQPSPDFVRDHMLLAVASDTACRLPPCGELYVSRDSGHSWSLLSPADSSGLQGTQLLLPPSGWPKTFYAFGTAGLQITSDGGHTFTTLIPDLPGYAGLMPPGSASNITVANVDLWSFATSRTPGLEAVYPPTAHAMGGAIAVLSATGWETLQPIASATGPEAVLRCSGGSCVTAGSLPWSAGIVQLLAGRTGSVLAINSQGLAYSTDLGASFRPLLLPDKSGPWEAALTRSPAGGVRIVTTLVGGNISRIRLSDDGGRTWVVATGLPDRSFFSVLRTLPDGSLIVRAKVAEANVYFCSPTGATWAGC